ncbi:MAG: Eco57I restriction-modification methylase domain-containing protein [Candidatus Delongbacteria bacterium]|nr:Eco57I restriction-modification methylase domain-containing protein [Candidatus Delongbacteria bacterium]
MYGKRSNGKEHGVVLTKSEVAKSMLDLIGYTSNIDLSKKVIVEPSAGEGVFVVEIIERLFISSKKYSYDFQEALTNLHFYEINEQSVFSLNEMISILLKDKEIYNLHQIVHQGDYLTEDVPKADYIIGNPPYVRHENIPENSKTKYKSLFKTFNQRSDLYIPFFEKSLYRLKPDGALCFISSNRWLKNQYGKSLRHLISQRFNLYQAINLEQASPFEEEVLAYPSIFHIRNNGSNINSYFYELNNINGLSKIQNNSVKPVREIRLGTTKGEWFSHNTYEMKNRINLSLIEAQNFKIGIGVATGKDSVFIRKDFKEEVEKELLIPILTSKDLKGDTFNWKGYYLINPYNSDGSLINLENYPKAKKYFFRNNEVLQKRHVAKKNILNWYKTIDKVYIDLVKQPKILLPDITGNKFIFIDEGKFYPHHNLYFISSNSIEELKILACFLMSEFVKNQLNENGNKMNGGYCRWQSQNLRKILIPYIHAIPSNYRERLIELYENMEIENINKLISSIDYSNIKQTVGQLTIFEPIDDYRVG